MKTPVAVLAVVAALAPSCLAAGRVINNCVNKKQVALTFDDGPYIYQKELVATLKAANVTATFFMNGNNYDCIYDLAEQIQATYKAGHVMANHGWEHLDSTKLSNAQLKSNIQKVDVALNKILGVKAALWRPPYGAFNDASVKVAKSIGYDVIYWSDDSGDSVGKSVAYSNKVYDAIAKSFPKPHLVLNHENKDTVQKRIPYAIKKLQAAGYELVDTATCAGIPAYHSVSKTLPKRDSSWKC